MRRRSFLSIVTLTGTGIGVGAWELFRHHSSVPRSSGETTSKTLSRETLDVLLLVADGMAGMHVEPLHYEAMFNWRAEHVVGQKEMIEKFVRFISDESQRINHRSFSSLDLTEREKLLEQVFSPTAAPSGVDSPERRDMIVTYRKEILRDILVVFGATDALVAVGYDGWEGVARGYSLVSLRPKTP